MAPAAFRTHTALAYGKDSVLDPQLKYLTLSSVDLFISDAGTPPRAKVCLQVSLQSLGVLC